MIQIRDLFGGTSNWSRTVKEFNSDALRTVGAFLKPMRKMTYFILLLAMVGITNNLLINYIHKRKSIAMYKSVGLSNQQNIKITLIEGFSCGLIGSIIGIASSYMELQTIFVVAGPKIAMVPHLNIGTFLMGGALGISVTLLGSLVPILKGTKMKLIEEIKFE
jgi:ABC-type antimicrobial peptide transport system permease subunit